MKKSKNTAHISGLAFYFDVIYELSAHYIRVNLFTPPDISLFISLLMRTVRANTNENTRQNVKRWPGNL